MQMSVELILQLSRESSILNITCKHANVLQNRTSKSYFLFIVPFSFLDVRLNKSPEKLEILNFTFRPHFR